jgi:tRNA (cmo5U34)-methyltransferase
MTSFKSERPEGMADFFDQRAQGYDQHMAETIDGFADFYAAIAQPIPSTRDALQILDIGCGTGLELSPILRRAPNARITGIDLSREMLRRLRCKFRDHLKDITLVQGSYLDLPFGIKRYNYAVSAMTLHHLTPSLKRALYSRVRAALKPGGIYLEGDYVVSKEQAELALATYQEIRDQCAGQRERRRHIDIPSSLDMLQRLFREAGFSEMKLLWQRGKAAVYLAGSLLRNHAGFTSI